MASWPRTIALSGALVLGGCVGGGGPAECALDADCAPGSFCAAGDCHQGTAQCPLLAPRFSDIERNLFRVGCGESTSQCHSAQGALLESGLDLQTDPYAALVGAYPANVAARIDGMREVKPGDPAGSFLVEKLRRRTYDPARGGGMPDTPVCDASIA